MTICMPTTITNHMNAWIEIQNRKKVHSESLFRLIYIVVVSDVFYSVSNDRERAIKEFIMLPYRTIGCGFIVLALMVDLIANALHIDVRPRTSLEFNGRMVSNQTTNQQAYHSHSLSSLCFECDFPRIIRNHFCDCNEIEWNWMKKNKLQKKENWIIFFIRTNWIFFCTFL